MKQTIPFKKDITFKTKIGELTAISLDNDLTLKGEDLIVGNFYISGNYKMLEGSINEEEYSYKIPCEIAISDEYDTFDATIDIDDFYYEIINDEILRVNITVVINNLERKEVIKDEKEKKDLFEDEILDTELESDRENSTLEDIKVSMPKEEELDSAVIIDKIDERTNSFYEAKENASKQSDTYLTYKVYIFKEEDTVEKVLEKYDITMEELGDYNDLENITSGTKLVIPSFND